MKFHLLILCFFYSLTHCLSAPKTTVTLTSLNDEPSDAVSLPMNISPCGSDTRSVIIHDATTSGSGPFGSCSSTFTSKDVWFKVIVPTTGNFLIRRNDNTAIQLYAEAYLELPAAASNVLACQSLTALPNVMVISGQTPGAEVYFRFWDKDNVATMEGEISAHQLASTFKDWVLCDYLNNGLSTINEESTKKANEFMVQYDADDTSDSILFKRNILMNELGLSLVDSCNCSRKNIEVWAANSPIEMEDRKLTSRKRGNVDTTAYNYLINISTLRDSLIETTIPNNNTGNQSQTDISMDATGNYIVVWRQASVTNPNVADIYARYFERDGTPKEIEFQVNAVNRENNQTPTVSRHPDGDVIVAWKSNQQILVKKYATGGLVLLGDTEIAKDDVDAFGNFTVSHPDVAMTQNGNYVVVYQKNYAGSTEKVVAKLFNATDVLQKTEELSSTQNSYHLPKVAMAENGQFMVVMETFLGMNPPAAGDDSYEVVKQSFDNFGAFVGSITRVNTRTDGAQITPQVAMDKDGKALVVWSEVIGIGKGDVRGKHFKSDGTNDGPSFSIDFTLFGEELVTGIAMNPEGDHVVVWESNPQDGDRSGIYGKYFDRNKVSQGGEFRVNTIATGNQQAAAVAINATGNVIFTWQEDRSDLDILHKRCISHPFDEPLKHYQESADTVGILKDTYDRTVYTPQNTVGNVIIATMDSGIDKDHSYFKNALWQYAGGNNCLPNAVGDIGYDFNNEDGDPNDLDNHGTPVNGLIVESFPNDLQLDIINAKFFEQGESTLFDAICGIYYAIENGAKVINLSWGFESIEPPAILQEAIEQAICSDILVVTSAGNTGKNNDLINKYPANLSKNNPNVITVAAYETDINGQNAKLSDYSNFGVETVDIAARGFFETTGLNNTFVSRSGTSLSAPVVSRIAGIIRAKFPQLTATQVKECLTHPDNVMDYNFPIRSKGALDEIKAMACAADKAAKNLPPCTSEKITGLNVNVTEETCAKKDGQIDLIITGSSADTTFQWSNGTMTQNLTGLSAGNYTVTVSDECGCIQTLAVTVSSACGVSNCEDGEMILEMPIQGRTYRVADKLMADDTIFTGIETTFQAGNSVVLNAGFTVQVGAKFVAKIGNCSSSNFLPTPPNAAKINSSTSKNLILKIAPNPTQESAVLTYFLPNPEEVQLNLLDLNGRVIQPLLNDSQAAGWQTFPIDNLQNGVYWVHLRTHTEVLTQQLIVLK